MSFMLSLSLTLRKRTVLMAFLMWFSNLVNFFVSVLLLQPSLLVGNFACAEDGDLSQLSNYRPISLTSALSKVFESILSSKIWKYLNHSNLISDRQYSFHKKLST